MTVLPTSLLSLAFTACLVAAACGEEPEVATPSWLGGGPMMAGFSGDRSTAFVYSSKISRFVTVSAPGGFDRSVLPTNQGDFCVFQTKDAVYAINANASKWAVLPNPGHAKVELGMNDHMLMAGFGGSIYMYGCKSVEWSGISSETGKPMLVTANGG